MANDQLIAPLKRVPIFKRLSDIQISALASNAERVIIQSGEQIITADQPGDAAFLIIKGDAVVGNGQYAMDEQAGLPEGTFIGEIAMLTEIDYSTTITARSDVRALKFSRLMIRDLMRNNPELAAHFVETLRLRMVGLAVKLRQIDQQLSSDFDTPAIEDIAELA